MGARHRDRDRSRDRDRDRERDRDRDKDRRSDRRRSRDRSSRDRHTRDRRSRDRRSRERGGGGDGRNRERSRDRDNDRNKEQKDHKTGAEHTAQMVLLDSMVGTTTTTSRNFTGLLAASTAMNNSNINYGRLMSSPHVETAEEARARRRRSRWGGGEHDKTFIPGMPTILPSSLSAEQQEAYLVQLQIEEVSRKLRLGDLGIPANIEERSPSPEPIYSSDGKRLNTREFRTRRRLEEQRHQLITRMQCINPEFKPPSDYKPPVIRVSDRVLIPQEEHPDVNFVGLLIGPRGNTLKSMEKDTGAKIIIRGKGSVKEGKVGRKDGQPLPGEDEPLHAFITASNPEHVKKAVDKIKEVIRQGIEVPEGHNDLRRMQLRELAQLNGTLRENDGPRCSNCGSTEHKSWLCPDKPNVTNNIVCSSCGGAGHIARDCRSKRPGMGGPPPETQQAKIDEEYMSLMAELGEGPAPEPNLVSNTNRNYNKNRGLFDNRQNASRAIMAPPPQPQMMPSMPPPPWGGAPQWNQMPPPSAPGIPPLIPWLASNSQPPPPGSVENKMPPPPGSMAPPGSMSLPLGSMPPPPGSMPPPPVSMPPPPGSMPPNMNGAQGMNNMGNAPWQMAPPYPWQHTYMAVPPGANPGGMNPMPVIPNLLAPPPPPPPS